MNDCNKCIWATRDGGCASWNCVFVDKNEAYDAWKEAHEQKSRLIDVLREVRKEK